MALDETGITDPRLLLGEQEDEERLKTATSLMQTKCAEPSKRLEMEQLFQMAMSGELPRYRELKYYEPDKMNPVHLEIIMMRACGFREKRIAEFLGCSQSMVSVVLRHPDAQFLLGKLLGYAAEDVIDIDTRLGALLPEAVDAVGSAIRGEIKNPVQLKAAFGVLDRKGYGVETKQKITHEVQIPERHAALLNMALQETRQIAEVDYVVVKSLPGSAGGASTSSEGGQLPSGGSGVGTVPPTDDSQVGTQDEREVA